MWRCVGLNIAPYIVLLLLLVVLAYVFPHIMSFYHAHFAIFESARKAPKTDVVIENAGGTGSVARRPRRRRPAQENAFNVLLE